MPLAAPLILPFAELAGITIAGLGMAAASKKVSDFISDNPEISTQILTTLVPGGVGLNALFKKKAKEDSDDESVEVAPEDKTREERAKEMKKRFKEGKGDKREIGKKGFEEVIKPVKDIEDLLEGEERYDGSLEDAPKPKFDYKKFFRNRNADGGAIGIEVLFEEKKDGGRIGFANGGDNIIGADLKDPDTEMNQMIQSPSNLLSVATGTGLHEQAMRDYLNPFSRNKNIQVGQGAVGDYMSNYLKEYIDPNNQAGGKFGERRGPNQMQVTGLGISPDPFSRTGIATAARLAEDPSFQAENLFGEGTLTQVPGGYDYTGGKFDFNFAGPLEEMIFGPSTYGMKFDKDMNPLDQFSRDFRAFDQAKMGNLSSGNNVRGDAISRTNVQGRDLEADLGTRINPDIQPQQNIFQRAGNVFSSIKDNIPNFGIMGLLNSLDRFDSLPIEDRQFILDQAGGNRPSKDPFGINRRSALGNYADYVRNKGIFAPGKRGEYYRSLNIPGLDTAMKETVAREQIAKRAYEKQIRDAADAASRNAARARSITAGYGGSDDSRGATGPTASGAGMGVGGGYASDYGFKKDGGMIGYRDGGVASMFVEKR